MRTESLLKCGGGRFRGSIQVVVFGEELVELSGKYAPNTDFTSATTESGELVGLVTGPAKAEAIIHILDRNERALDIKLGKISVEAKILGELADHENYE